MRKLNVTFCSFPDYTGNARALYDYIKVNYKDKFNYTWVIFDEEIYKKMVNDFEDNVVLVGTKEFNNYISKTDVFFTTHANLIEDKRKTKNGIYIELWHGVGPKPGGLMVNNMTKKDGIWYSYLSKSIDYLIVPSEFWRPLFSSSFGLEYQRVLPLGYPKLDYYLKPNAKDKLSKVLNKDVSSFSKIIFYTPTFRSGCGRSSNLKYGKNIINIKPYDEKNFLSFLEDNNYLLCVKLHPSEEGIYLNAKEISENVAVIQQGSLEKHGYDVNEILSCADVLITDFSSLGVEFLFLNKPVIYISFDEKEYASDRGIIFDDYDFWASGSKVGCYEQLEKALGKYLDDTYKFEQKFMNKKKLWFGDLKNGGCHQICNFVFDGEEINKSILDSRNNNYVFEEEIKKLKEVNKEQISTIKRLTESDIELNQIKESKGWKLLEKLRKINRGFKENEKN